jgi:Kef-type K+ transport system membrane component KefB
MRGQILKAQNVGEGVVVAEDAILLLVVPLIASSVFGILARHLGFSAIAGYILGGVIVGPILHLVDTQSPLLSFLSELGIILISFVGAGNITITTVTPVVVP